MNYIVNPLTYVGNAIRDTLIMPDPKKESSSNIFDECKRVLDPNVSDPVFYPNKGEVLKLFKKTEEWINHSVGNRKFKTNVLIFQTNFFFAKETHTCVRVGGGDELLSLSSMRIMPFLSAFQRETDRKTNLRFIQVSLFESQEEKNGKFETWKAANFEEIGKVIFSFLEGLKNKKISVDSMICHSMGGAVLENLKSIDCSKVPKTLILDRILPSIWKVGRQLMNPILCCIVYFFAYCSGWNGNPEQSLVSFFENIKNKSPALSLSDRNVVIIEAEHDFFFSNHGAFDKDLAKRLNKLGVNAFQKSFTPNHLRIHFRAHHACPIDHLVNTGPIQTGKFSMGFRQDVASAIVNNIFMRHAKSN